MRLKGTIAALAIAAATGGSALAAEVAPTDVVYEDGAITQSLSGGTDKRHIVVRHCCRTTSHC